MLVCRFKTAHVAMSPAALTKYCRMGSVCVFSFLAMLVDALAAAFTCNRANSRQGGRSVPCIDIDAHAPTQPMGALIAGAASMPQSLNTFHLAPAASQGNKP